MDTVRADQVHRKGSKQRMNECLVKGKEKKGFLIEQALQCQERLVLGGIWYGVNKGFVFLGEGDFKGGGQPG